MVTLSKKRRRSVSKSKSPYTRRTKRQKSAKSRLSPPSILQRNKYIIYHEGGNVFRPFIIIELQFSEVGENSDKWITQNIAFYKTSGQSNDQFNGIYARTWLPTSGLLPENSIVNGKPEEKGYIFKMSTLNGEPTIRPELCEIIKKYLDYKYSGSFSEITKDILSEEHNINKKIYLDSKNKLKIDIVNIYFTILSEYKEIHDLIGSYFAYCWQLYISVKIGTGYWERNPSFGNFIMEELSYKQEFVKIPSDETIANIPTETVDRENINDVIDFLRDNKALAVDEIHNFVKNTTISTCNAHYLSKYSVVKAMIERHLRTQAAISKIKNY